LKLTHRQLTTAGVLGLLAAILVGAGEFLLHFDALGRFAEGGAYEFMRGINENRTTIGHFLGVLIVPLYIIGFWHLMKMLEPANVLASRIAFVVMSYGIIIGAVWIGSRAGISTIVNSTSINNPASFISLYELRYENLLQVTRLAVLVFSGIFIWLVLSGRSHYPRWMALFNPIILILASFAIWAIVPVVGIYLMPIALNVAFALLFLFSIYYSRKIKE
jgi:hypothetical protein